MMPVDARRLVGDALAAALREARAHTWALVGDLTAAQWLMPCQAGVNPVAWELAHLAWFAEFWILRGPHQRSATGFATAALPPLGLGPDEHLDSAQLAHAARWITPLPSRAPLQEALAQQLEACIAAIPRGPFETAAASDAAHYFHRLALFHEDMHAEALCWMRSALGYAAPPGLQIPRLPAVQSLHVAAQPVTVGAPGAAGGDGFAFDNESPAKPLELAEYSIMSTPVCVAAYALFIRDNGYFRPEFWPGTAGNWLRQTQAAYPERWRPAFTATPAPAAGAQAGSGWQIRWFDTWIDLPPDAPALHLNAFEAEAYCRWAKCRLPRAAEWEHAAKTQADFHWGHSVWEWTSDDFAPYPGFAPGPYAEYSAPWFGNHRELRGGAFATQARMHHPSYRNFFMPQRSDIFAGFRTVALDGSRL